MVRDREEGKDSLREIVESTGLNAQFNAENEEDSEF